LSYSNLMNIYMDSQNTKLYKVPKHWINTNKNKEHLY